MVDPTRLRCAWALAISDLSRRAGVSSGLGQVFGRGQYRRIIAARYGVLAGFRTHGGAVTTRLRVKAIGTDLSPRRLCFGLRGLFFSRYPILVFSKSEHDIFAILEVWWITAILMALHVDLTVIGIRAVLKRSGILLAQAVPLMLVIFFIFPRLDPFWAVPIQSNSGVTGVSDRMNPGDIANLSRSAQVAFRAKFEGESPSSRDLYW